MELFKRLGIEIKSDNIWEGAIYGLACAYLLIEKDIANYLRPFKLTPAKFNALMIIKHQGKDKGLSQVEIGKRLIVTESNMTRLLDRLEKKGFIERLPQKKDRRIKLIKITKQGSDMLDEVWPGYYQKIKQVANTLDKHELKQFSRIIIHWCNKLENGEEKQN